MTTLHKASLLLIAVTVSWNFSLQPCHSQLIAADSYDNSPGYTYGGLNGQNPAVNPGWSGGNAWVSGSANAWADFVSLERVATTFESSSNGKGKFVGPNFDLFRRAFRTLDSYTPASTYYMSFFVNPGGQFTSAGGRGHALVGFTNAFDEAAFENDPFSANVFGVQVGFRGEDVGADPDTIDLILRTRKFGSGDLTDTVLLADAGNEPFGTTYHVLLKLDVNVLGGTVDNLTYWVNPEDISSESAATSSATATDTIVTAAVDAFDRIDRFNVLTNNWTNRSFYWDETRFGYDFASVVGLPSDADFNSDSFVDGVDFLTWQRNVGTGSTQPDGDADLNGAVNRKDLEVWEARYGAQPLLSVVQTVPEPISAVLLVFGTVWSLCGRLGRTASSHLH